MESLQRALQFAIGLPTCPNPINPPLHPFYPSEINYCVWDRCLKIATISLEEHFTGSTQIYHLSNSVNYTIAIFLLAIMLLSSLRIWRFVSESLHDPKSVVSEGSQWPSWPFSSWSRGDSLNSSSTIRDPNSHTTAVSLSDEPKNQSQPINITHNNSLATQNDIVETPTTPNTILPVDQLRAKKAAGLKLSRREKQRLREAEKIEGGDAIQPATPAVDVEESNMTSDGQSVSSE